MVSTKENLGNFPPPELGWARILGAVEEPRLGERFENGGISIAENSRRQPGNRIYDHGGRKFSAGKNVIANGKLLVGKVFGYALVNAFITAADEEDFVISCKPAGRGLVKPGALGR